MTSLHTINTTADLLHMAQYLAELGMLVFPCSLDKRPLTKHGFKDASSDPELIRRQWTVNPGASIGVPMGRKTGMWCLDIDQPEGPETLRKLEELHGRLPATRAQMTGGGGFQYFFKFPEDREVRNNSRTKLGPGIDIRGEGGYSILPPSGHPSGGTYTWLTSPDATLADAPEWLLERVCSKAPFQDRELQKFPPVEATLSPVASDCPKRDVRQHRNSEWAEAALEDELGNVQSACKGSRNDTLFKSAAALGEIIAGGALDHGRVERALHNAAHAVGLEDSEINKTITSGFEAGKRNPRPGPKAGLHKPPQSATQELIASAGCHGAGETEDTDKPTLIVHSGELVALADAAEDVLLKAETPVFQRGGMLVRIAQLPELTQEHGVERAAGTTIIKPVSAHWLLDCLGRLSRFAKLKPQGKLLYFDPPMVLALSLLARVGQWGFQPLRGVLPGPAMRADGSILNTAGYDKASCYYLAESLTLELPASPTKEGAASALTLLKELLHEFPFESVTDMSVALAMILTPLVRPAVGKIPLFCVNSPTRGSGKSTLVRLCATLATGRPAPVIAATGSGDELEKRLTASLLAGDGLILQDNINGELRSDLLSQAVTEGTLSIRPLGVSDQVKIVSDSIWIANGNGLTIGGDLSRRGLKCTLDAKLERPECRAFKNDPVREAQRRRSELVAAGLTVLQAYHLHGRPGAKELRPWAGFEPWSSLVRGALVWLGMPDPLDSADQLQADDPERELLGELLKHWHNQYGNREMTVREVILETERSDMDRKELAELLKEVAGTGITFGIDARSLGRWLTSKQGRIVDGRYLKKAGSTGGSARWRVLTR
jgi:Bifunctional DNA primase/polymerase, N-terminal.